MRAVTKQQQLALRHAHLVWSQQLEDPRQERGRRHLHAGLLALLVVGFACGKLGLREAEELSEELGPRTRKKLQVPTRVSDSTLWRLLATQTVAGLRQTLREWVKAMLRRVRPRHVLPLGVVSFDGKSLYTGFSEVPGLESVPSDKEGTASWRLGALRAALTSVPGVPCLDLEFIGAKEGESPAFRQLLPRVVEHFGEHFQVVTGDAGLCAAENATHIRSLGKHYLLGLKGNQPTLHTLAVLAIANNQGPCRARTVDRAHGATLTRELWTYALRPGETDFPDAHLLLGVRQTTLKPGELPKVAWRYFVTCLSTTDLSFKHLLHLVRLHWGIENLHHWTLDCVLIEDERQPCLDNAQALQVTAWLRTLAYNILATWRAALPLQSRLPVSWKRATETIRDALVHGRTEALLPTWA
jgi:hypothetical protein